MNKLKQYRQALRKTEGITQAQLAERAGIPLPTYRAYEQGRRSLGDARADTVHTLAQLLGCTMEDLLNG